MRIHTGIGGVFLLVEGLDQVERHLGRITELAVAIDLQRGEVVELWWLFLALFLLHLRHRKRLALDGGKGLLALFLRGEFPRCRGEGGITIHRCQYPVGFGLEVLDLFLTVHDEGEGRGLHTTYREHLTVLAVLQRVQSRGVHAQQPVTNGSR